MRKHLLIITMILLSAGVASAQTGKGNYYVGGNFNYNYDGFGYNTTTYFTTGRTFYTNNHISNFQVNPDFGFFFADKWAIGIQPGYSRTWGTETSYYNSYTGSGTTNFTVVDHYHSDAVSLGIHLRYYWMLIDKIGIFPQFGVTTAHDVKYLKSGSLTLGGNPNIVFFATPKLAVNLGFGNLQYQHDYQTKSNSFNVGLNTNVSFGVNYYWGKK